jgi:hypothetical protein
MNATNTPKVMPPEAFAGLGGGQVAYVKPVRSEEVKSFFPNAPALAPGLKLWALLNADGTPIMVADNREALLLNASEHDLETVSVH